MDDVSSDVALALALSSVASSSAAAAVGGDDDDARALFSSSVTPVPLLQRAPSLPLSQPDASYGVLQTTDTLVEIARWLDRAALRCFALTCRDWSIVARERTVIVTVFKRACSIAYSTDPRHPEPDAWKIIDAVHAAFVDDALTSALLQCALDVVDAVCACLDAKFDQIEVAKHALLRSMEHHVFTATNKRFQRYVLQLFANISTRTEGERLFLLFCANAVCPSWIVFACFTVDRIRRCKAGLGERSRDEIAAFRRGRVEMLLPPGALGRAYMAAVVSYRFANARFIRSCSWNLEADFPLRAPWIARGFLFADTAAKSREHLFGQSLRATALQELRAILALSRRTIRPMFESSYLTIAEVIAAVVQHMERLWFAAVHLLLDHLVQQFPSVPFTCARDIREALARVDVRIASTPQVDDMHSQWAALRERLAEK